MRHPLPWFRRRLTTPVMSVSVLLWAALLAVPGALVRADEPEQKAGVEPSSPTDESAGTEQEGGRVKFARLETVDGKVYENCTVVRVEPDSITVRHHDGMARILLFELPAEVQNLFSFDPFEGMDYYKSRYEQEKALRWQAFWEMQRAEAEEEERLRQEAEERRIIELGFPVEARISEVREDGVVAYVKRITFMRTKTKSTLGVTIDGPVQRRLVDMPGNPLLLMGIQDSPGISVGQVWKGYIVLDAVAHTENPDAKMKRYEATPPP